MRTWLITGCSSGIGRAIALAVLEHGDRVVATARRQDAVGDLSERYPERVLTLSLDVTDPNAPASAVREAASHFRGIDVLVNNAGYGYVTAVEEGDEASVRAMFEVNFYGAVRMMKAVLPAMRARRSGRIIQISSLTGRIANPAVGYYSASKHALEAVSEAAGRELAGSGVFVTSIAPGAFQSDFAGRSLQIGPRAIDAYRDTAHARMDLVRASASQARGDPVKLAQVVLAVARMSDPPRQLLLGPDAYDAVIARMDEQRAAIVDHSDLSLSTDRDT